MKIIILAGGKGTRLWPMSRKTLPKQFLKINNKTLFRKTVDRCLLIEKPENIFISTNKDYSFLAEKELKGTEIKKENIIIEPFSKNTGPAILFAIKELKIRENELILVCPSDHFITPDDEFAKDVKKAEQISSLNNIVTFGIKPLSPETGYGYIETKKSLLKTNKNGVEYYKVENFIEKPNLEKAQKLLESGNYYWNSGIFLFPFKLMMEEFEKHAKNLIDDFEKIEPISIDKAVIEKSNKIVTIPVKFNWSDVGSWNSFYKTQKKDNEGNVLIGNTLARDTKNSLILGNNRLVTCFGLENIAIVETEDVVLVAPKNRSEEVKLLVEDLEKRNKKEVFEGIKTIRPWGSYTIIEEGNGYKIKKIIVDPKKRLSLQAHNHRSEHWVVIQGNAKIILDNEECYLKKGESLFVPKKAKHRLENPHHSFLEIIEVQNGDYLGEDDIIRYEDDYGRIKKDPF
ncbi:MAG: sugar phosphate nucleotidyltransferase [Minisyncoccales bacterium]|jgi:mannose-1-phosphate guanylyltransferase/mannose-6-phosphate isomerase